ncbi:MAG: hypothetical protein NC251_01690 [Lachnoclostridium sp.]|nr:hypothetical protein [Lachnospira sp.]MCM1247120.1 hypothetical protein [Lachnoclostridium sp.]
MKKRIQGVFAAIAWCVGTVGVGALWTVLCAFLAVGSSILMAVINRRDVNTEATGNIAGWLTLIGWGIIIGASLLLWRRFRSRCPICKRWAAVVWADTEQISETKISVPITTRTRNRDGEVIGTSEQYVPGSRYTYCDTYRCKYCGHEEKYKRQRDCANI